MAIDDPKMQEARCRRLAAQSSDDALRDNLLRIADEYAADAASLKAGEGESEPDSPVPILPGLPEG